MALDGFEYFLARMDKFISTGKISEVFFDVMEYDSKEITDMVRKQLMMGIDGNGESVYLTRPIGGKKYTYYAYRTEYNKLKYGVGLGAQVDPISTYKSGAFYESLYVEVFKDGSFQVLSSDEKFELIKARSGPAIIDLNEESEIFLFGQKIGPDFQIAITNAWTSEVE